MTVWNAICGDILDVAADALVCSANPQLNLSGGVGGAFALRYGDAMQSFLHEWLLAQSRSSLGPGEVVVAPSCGSPFRVVIHAVAVDAFYETKAGWIRLAYENAFHAARDKGCRTIAAACLACGYGRATPETFIKAIRPLVGRPWPDIARITFAAGDADLVVSIRSRMNL